MDRRANITMIRICCMLLVVNPTFIHSQTDSISIGLLLDSSKVALQKNDLDLTRSLLDQIYAIYSSGHLQTDRTYVDVLLEDSKYFDRIGTYQAGLEVLDRAENILENLDDTDISAQYKIVHGRAAFSSRLGDFQNCLVFAQKAFDLAMSRDTQDLMTANAYNILSTAHFNLYNIETAIEINEKLLVLLQKLFGPDHLFTAGALSNQANNYGSLKRFDIALSYLQRSRMIMEEKDSTQFDLQRLNYLIGKNLKEQGSYEAAIQYLEKAIWITALYQPTHQFIGEDHREIGECERALGNMPAALKRFDQALEIYIKRGQEENFMVARVYRSYAQLYEEIGDLKQAYHYHDLAARHSQERLGDSHPNVSTYTRAKALIEAKMDRFDQAKTTINHCLEMLQLHQSLIEDGHMVAKKHLFHAFSVAGLVYLISYKSTCEVEDLYNSLQSIQSAVNIVHLMRADMEAEADQLKFGAESIDIYAQGVEVAYLLYTLTDSIKYCRLALQFSEQSRSSTMLDALLRKMSNGLFGLPAELQMREKSLTIAAASLEEELIDEKSKSVFEQIVIDSVERQIFDTKEKLRLLRDSIRIAYPEYYAIRYVKGAQKLEDIERNLNEDQCIIQYFDCDDFVYVFSIEKEILNVKQIRKDSTLLKNIQRFVTNIANPDTIMIDLVRSQEQLGSAAYALYMALVRPIAISPNIKELIISPDGLEAKLSFEIFLSRQLSDESSRDPRDWSYLFRQYSISYAQSLTAWQEQHRLEPKAKRQFLGFAPEYHFQNEPLIDTFDQPLLAMVVRDGEGQLPFSPLEVQKIRDLTGGEVYIGPQATERTFRQHCNEFSVIHMSAHAILDDRFPARNRFLLTSSEDSIYDDQLTAIEICHLDLSAELAVLSACHTGAGLINRGEGIMSLGRAFAFAGVPATVQSLWRVPDETTSRLMPYFYSGLKKGLQKHEALNAARIEFLDHTNIATQRHPYFWAGFILYGNTAPLSFAHSSYKLLWGVMIGLTIGGIIYLLRRFYL
ncbi:MAG: CHAT domain-containing protein [Saprospiraceae bacterium]|nr:CHAT domain-containing protein [Saprospiraceae bacterium]